MSSALRSEVILTEEVPSEVSYPAVANIFFDAFDHSWISKRISPPERRLAREKRVAAWVYDRQHPSPSHPRSPNEHLVLAVLPSTGEIAGFSIWISPSPFPSKAPAAPAPPSTSKEEEEQAKPDVVKEVQASEDGPWTATFDAEMKRVRTKWAEGRGEEEKERGYWYLKMLGVSPKHQGLKIGSKLLAWGTDQAKKDGVPCWLESSDDGLEVYKHKGWKIVDWCELPDEDLEGGKLRWPGMVLGA